MKSEARCWGVIPAAGIGARMAAAQPKQYLEVAGKSLLQHSLDALLAIAAVEAVVVALGEGDARAPALVANSRVRLAVGGARRADSVLAALRVLQEFAHEDDWVLVHDAARPCLLPADGERLVAAVLASGTGALLAEPVVDTIKRVAADGRVLGTLDRSQLWRAQTPQMFRLGELVGALEGALWAGAAITDEASAMEWAGHPVAVVPGSSRNLKVTVPQDLALAAFYLSESITG
ncbi:2-C-methyl-D-erythritol 4-phosphate cytidylyltransferase [Haliea sp. E1-2-M8]|uniref:2-C-methyl-D-erythritol 4-phosphate cytidylyltransferase n=1 Tax=Haliea sp. E1-2-M8 TaxID=3064706 RepID=UPI0027207919|nr:2-C-methyl-D-erythritol 4-phosphate cytidylyltransferase [Haliea sp. E1-2-M8]MDO8861250.1 2-C-methyl-D-erythritol 4-phosphate cytidylyltransferase [Haliea sp. E1-2-M8]